MTWAPSQIVLRVVVGLAPMLALLVVGLVSGGVSVVAVVLLLGLVAVAALVTDSVVLAVALLLVVAQWLGRAPDPLSPWILVVAGLLLAAQIGATCCEYGPRGLRLPSALYLRWAVRAVAAMAVCAAALGTARAVAGRPDPPGLWGAVVAMLVVACWAAHRRLRVQPADDPLRPALPH